MVTYRFVEADTPALRRLPFERMESEGIARAVIWNRVDPCLHGDILRCITARAILVGKLVHIIQKNNGRRFSRRFGKGLRNAVDKGIATLVAAYRDGV